jgi:hypothetical protein
MANDATRKLECSVTVIGFRRSKGIVENFSRKTRSCCFLEFGDEFSRRRKSLDTLIAGADVG